MRHPATATVKGEKKMDDVIENSLERFRASAFCREMLLLAALDWRGVVEFQRSK
jgi:hypothetical protein